ncbi:MAG: histidine kinase N-terminal 7TM domain-containing protein, partial [Thermoplasmata archaeon]
MIIVKLILFFSFLVNFALGGMVYLKTNISFNRANLMFSILSWALALWILSVLMIHQFKNTPLMLFWGKMSFVSASIIPSSYLYFSLLFPNRDYSITKIKFALLFLPTLFFVVFSFTPFILKGVSYIDWGLKTIYGPLHPLFSFYLIGYVLLGHFIFLKKYRESKGLERLQIKYFFLGMLLTSVFAVTTNLIFPLLGTSKYSSLGPSFSIIMVGFTTYSILKHRLMDINIVLKKGTTYTLLMALIFVPSFILILLGQKIFFGKINTLFSLVLSGILFLVAILFNKIKPSTERAVEQILFREKYNYRETLGKFSRAMVSILELRSLAKRIVETITQTMGVEKASFFLLNDERGGFELFESKNIKLTSPTLILSKNAPLPHYLQKIGEIIIKEELAKGIHIPELKEVFQQMNDIEAEASIPLISKGHLIGILNLSHKFSKDIYSHEDIELLTTLANQASIAVENA